MSRYAMCPRCGHRMRRVINDWGFWDGETYACDWCNGGYGDDETDDESISVEDAALIWVSNGRDEDYMFGFSEEELENAL